jgi:glycosyltransferase involved in cell wall biosynthesis
MDDHKERHFAKHEEISASPLDSDLQQPAKNTGITLSVITVCRNAEKTIESTLQSVAMQENVAGKIEHIVVDGASQDDTLKIVKQFPTIRWISEPDDGISDAFNKGALLAEGEYVLYLNADDYLSDQNVLHDVLSYIKINNNPDWIVGDVFTQRQGEITVQQRRYPPSCWSLFLRNRICHQAVFLKRRALLEVGGFENRFKMAMDYDLWQRLCASGYKIAYIPRIISVYSHEGLTSSESPALAQEFQEVERRFRNTPLKGFIGNAYDLIKGRY